MRCTLHKIAFWLAFALATAARGGMEWNWVLTPTPTHLVGDATIINDNNGAIYDSYQVKLADLANQIYSNNLSLHGTYSSGADLVADGMFTYGINPNGEVDGGWRSEIQTNGDVQLTHGSGDINGDYDGWYATQQNSSQDMQRGTLGIRKTFLDLDGDGWTTNDLRIGNDTNQIVAGGVAQVNSWNLFPDLISRLVVILPVRHLEFESTHAWFGTNTIGNPTGSGPHLFGDAVKVSVDRIVVDSGNPGRRLRFKGAQSSNEMTSVIGLSGNLAFGPMPTGCVLTAAMTITNSGLSPFTVTNISYPSGFSGAWTGIVYAGGASNVMVTFAPTTVGQYAGAITIRTPTAGLRTIYCSGIGLAEGIVVSGNLAFGSVPTGEVTTAAMSIANYDFSPVAVTNIVYPDGFDGSWTGMVAARSATNVTVSFSPTAIQNYGGTIMVQTQPAVSLYNTIICSGRGLAEMIGVSGNMAFNFVPTGTVAKATMTIANYGFSPFAVTNIVYPDGFGGSCTGVVAARGATNVIVSFSPTVVQNYGGIIMVQPDAGRGSNTLACSGSVIAISNAAAKAMSGVQGCAISTDIDGDGMDEVVACNGNWVATYRYDSQVDNYTELWRQEFLRANQVCFGDIDHDGVVDMLVSRGSWYPEHQGYVVFKKSAADEWVRLGSVETDDTWNQIPFGNRVLSIGDCDGDGRNEIVGHSWFGTMGILRFNRVRYALDAFERLYSHYIYNVGGRATSSLVGDADNNGANEVICGTTNGWRIYTNGGNESNYTVSFSNQPTGRQEIVLGDLNNDGKNEILVTSGDTGRGVRIFRHNESSYIQIWEAHLGEQCGKPIIGKILENGRNQFAFLAQGKLVVYEYVNGVPEMVWEKDLGSTMVSNWNEMELALGDPDRSGKTSLMVSWGWNLTPMLLKIWDSQGGGP